MSYPSPTGSLGSYGICEFPFCPYPCEEESVCQYCDFGAIASRQNLISNCKLFQLSHTQSSEAQFFFWDVRETLAYAKHRFDVKHCINVEHSCFVFSLHVQLCLHIQLILHRTFVIGLLWTRLDRSVFLFATFWIQNASQNSACRTKDVRYQNSLTRPTQQLRKLTVGTPETAKLLHSTPACVFGACIPV